LLHRFNLEELRQACGDIADVEMTPLLQTSCQFVDSLARSNRNLDPVSEMERINDEDEEIDDDATSTEL